MGCDIHPYIEHKTGFRGEERWETYCYGQVQFSRHYDAFALMADVRNYNGIVPVAQPKGIPDNLSWYVDSQFYYRINDEYATEQDECGHEHRYKYCTIKQAEEWAKHFNPIVRTERGGKIQDPDAHTPSWMTVAELEEVQSRLTEMNCPSRDLMVIIATMKALNEDDPTGSRLVFWFDN